VFKNTRARWLGLIALGGILVAVLAVYLTAGGGVRPIEELNTVRYVGPGEFSGFYDLPESETIGWVQLPTRPLGREFESDVDLERAGFVRPQVCGECHPDHWKGIQETAHYRTSSEASRLTVLGGFGPEQGVLKTRDPSLHYEMLAAGDKLLQRVVVQRSGKTYQHEQPIDIVTGSGNHGQTYLYWHGDGLYQLPISFFSETGRWINSPGLYRDGAADFARDIGRRCLDCHATFFASSAGPVPRYDRKSYILGVTCVRCHGHGWAHVQYHRTHPKDVEPRYIVHPGKLPRDRANEVCAQCHSGGTDLLAPAFTYQPGDPLDKYLAVHEGVDDPQNDDPHAANQLARLMKSRCYQASDTLTCASCHDPHHHERDNLKVFAERCAKCHESGDCKVAAVTPTQIKDHCVECHMPSRRDAEGAMQTPQGAQFPLLRDHFIRVWPELTDQTLKKLPKK
jgi:hypothetical protein